MELLSLSEQLGKFNEISSGNPPLDKWNPDLSGDIDIRIASDGTWWHEGDEIKRDKLARLFSTILKVEKGDYYLITPVEKWRIQVDDLPFLVVLCEITPLLDGLHILLMTSLGNEIEVSTSNPIQIDGSGLPRVEVRDGLFARLNRNVYYQLAELAKEEGGQYVLFANGAKHVIG